jgi:hypothetical protein
MTPTLNMLPQCTLELRPLRDDGGSSQDRCWLLRSRDDRARPLWEVVLSTPMLHALLECLAEGHDAANAGALQLRIYPDPELERFVMNWATQQLARYAGGLAEPLLPRGRSAGRIQNVSARLL